MSDSSDLSTSDEASDSDQNPIPLGPEQRWIRPRVNYFVVLSNKRFFKRFRLDKSSVRMLLGKIEHFLEPQTERNAAIPPMIQLLLALRFFATGSFFMTVGDFVGVSTMSAFRIIHRVSEAIASLRSEFIQLPTTLQQLRQIQTEFFNISGFIHVMGCVDCKQVKVQSYGGDDSEVYRNRKSFFSINVQAVVNSRLEFMDIVARWPGSAHDVTIFNNSRIKYFLDNDAFGNVFILGDSAYPNGPYFMTPLTAPVTPAEHSFNEALIRTRNIVEWTFGVWSRKFSVLHIGSRFHKVERTLNMIIAAAVLHNIARKVQPAPQINPNIYDAIPQVNYFQPLIGVDARQHLINTYFHSLLY